MNRTLYKYKMIRKLELGSHRKLELDLSKLKNRVEEAETHPIPRAV